MNNMNKYKTLYNYVKGETKKSGGKLTQSTRYIFKNLGLDNDSVTVDSFCTKFDLEVNLDTIMSFINNPDNAYEISRFGHNSQNYILNSCSRVKQTCRYLENFPDDYGL